jgi:y4mF family transcriptional regulator
MQKRLDIAAGEAKRIGEAIRAARKAVSLRQDELALAAGVSTRVVHQLESGKATSRLDSLIPVLAVLGLRLRVDDDR